MAFQYSFLYSQLKQRRAETHTNAKSLERYPKTMLDHIEMTWTSGEVSGRGKQLNYLSSWVCYISWCMVPWSLCKQQEVLCLCLYLHGNTTQELFGLFSQEICQITPLHKVGW